MAFLIRNTLEYMESLLRTKGYITHVTIGEPTSPPATNGITAAIYMDSSSIQSLTLANTVDEINVAIRFYEASSARSTGNRDDQLELAFIQLESAFLGDVDLDASIRDILPIQITAAFGYLEQGGIEYRVVDCIIPFLVDGNATLAA